MSYENSNQEIPYVKDRTIEVSDLDLTVIKNEIQLALMADFGITDNEGARNWIHKYAKDFSEYIHENIELADMWKNENNRQTVLQTLIQAEKDGFRSQRDVA